MTYYELDGSARAVSIDPLQLREIIERTLKTAKDKAGEEVLAKFDSWLPATPQSGRYAALRGDKTEFHITIKTK